MHSFIHPILQAAVAIILFPTSIHAQSEWKSKRNTEGIEVFYRDSATSNIKELRIKVTVDATLNQTVSLLTDVSAYPSWIHSCVKSKTVKKVSPQETFYHSIVDFPRPMSDRDMVVRGTFNQDSSTLVVTMEGQAAPTLVPETKGMVRVKNSHTLWTLTPVGKDKVEIDYRLASDPGGSIPDWAINAALAVGPVKSIKKMRRLLSNTKYKNPKAVLVTNYTGSE